jgi:hypothetical protein
MSKQDGLAVELCVVRIAKGREAILTEFSLFSSALLGA